jgi:hypothetical protein
MMLPAIGPPCVGGEWARAHIGTRPCCDKSMWTLKSLQYLSTPLHAHLRAHTGYRDDVPSHQYFSSTHRAFLTDHGVMTQVPTLRTSGAGGTEATTNTPTAWG